MHLFTVRETYPGRITAFNVAPSLDAAIKLPNLTDDERKLLSEDWLPETEGRDEWTRDFSSLVLTISKVRLDTDGSNAFDAGILELAAVILRRRYGLQGAGATVRVLTELSRAITKEK